MGLKIVKKKKGRPCLDQQVLSALYSIWRSQNRLKEMLRQKNMPASIVVNELRHGIKLTLFLDDAKKTLLKEDLL